MTEAIEVISTSHDQRVLYALRFLFGATGYPFRMVRSWNNPALRVACDTPSTRNAFDADMFFSVPDRYEGKLNATFVDTTPILYWDDRPTPTQFDSNGVVYSDALGITYSLLSRAEEARFQDVTGLDPRFEGYRSQLYDLGLLQQPVLNHLVNLLRAAIERILARRNVSLNPLPLWKDDAQFAVALTHDIDRIRYFSMRDAGQRLMRINDSTLTKKQRFETLVMAMNQFARTARHQSRAVDPFWNFERWLDLEDRYGLRSTFYAAALTTPGSLGDPTYRFSDVVHFRGARIRFAELLRRELEGGWEIGLHSSVRTCCDPRLLRAEKSCLEENLGQAVHGVRQHLLMFEVPRTWRAQEACGFEYDTTLGFNRRLGHRAGVALPFFPFDGAQMQTSHLLELPLTIQDGAVLDEEPAGVEHTVERCIRILKEVERARGLAVLLWHPNTAYEAAYPGWFTVYAELLAYLEHRQVFAAPAGEIASWWRKRCQSVELDGEY